MLIVIIIKVIIKIILHTNYNNIYDINNGANNKLILSMLDVKNKKGGGLVWCGGEWVYVGGPVFPIL